MLLLRVLFALLAIQVPRGSAAHHPNIIGFEDVIQDVQDAIRKLVFHRQNFIQSDMRATCESRQMPMLMKVTIVKGPRQNASLFENYAYHGDDCIIHVYDAGVLSLQKWCSEVPQRELIYRQNRSDSAVPANPLIVSTKCTLFDEDDFFTSENVETCFRMLLLVTSVVLILLFFSWLLRRDVVVIVNNTPAAHSDNFKQLENGSYRKNHVESENHNQNEPDELENTEKMLLISDEEREICQRLERLGFA